MLIRVIILTICIFVMKNINQCENIKMCLVDVIKCLTFLNFIYFSLLTRLKVFKLCANCEIFPFQYYVMENHRANKN